MVIATVFLTIIGGTAGFLLGERHRRVVSAASSEQTQSGQTQQQTPVTWPSSANADPSGPSCPPETLRKSAALGYPAELWQVLKIQTDNGTTVWICRDTVGKFYYQSKTGGLDAPLVQDQNGLFMYDVTQLGVDDYVCLDVKGTRIEVTRKQLVVHRPDGRAQYNPVTSAE